jgi:hypothetical protein
VELERCALARSPWSIVAYSNYGEAYTYITPHAQRIKMTTICIRLASLIALVFFASCATITRGTTDTLVVQSTPAGADVKLDNGMTGKTPTSFKLPRDKDVIVSITKDGYEPIEVRVTSQISGGGGAGMAGNILFGGIIGGAVDAGSGAMNDLVPNPIAVTLVELKPSNAGADQPVALPAVNASPSPKTTKEDVEKRLTELKQMLEAGTISQTEYDAMRQQVLQSMVGTD